MSLDKALRPPAKGGFDPSFAARAPPVRGDSLAHLSGAGRRLQRRPHASSTSAWSRNFDLSSLTSPPSRLSRLTFPSSTLRHMRQVERCSRTRSAVSNSATRATGVWRSPKILIQFGLRKVLPAGRHQPPRVKALLKSSARSSMVLDRRSCFRTRSVRHDCRQTNARRHPAKVGRRRRTPECSGSIFAIIHFRWHALRLGHETFCVLCL